MTIRYKCEECGAVLKVKDELAGTDGKCPKCKTHFTVPVPEDETPGIEIDESPEEPDDVDQTSADDEFVDLPPDVTPEVDMPPDITPAAAAGGDFDPMDVLGSGHSPPGRVTATEHRPSVAELMRDYEKTKKKSAPPKEKPAKGNLAAAAAAAGGVVTSGSAADVLSRTYEKKRGKASPAPMSREQQRAAEQKEAMKTFALQAGLGIAGVIVVAYFLVSWMNRESLPDLANVTGVVTLSGKPLSGARVQFAPLKDPNGAAPEAGPSVARTNDQGEYELMYDPVNEGAAIGWHHVELSTREGMMINLPESSREIEVTDDGDNVFDFNL